MAERVYRLATAEAGAPIPGTPNKYVNITTLLSLSVDEAEQCNAACAALNDFRTHIQLFQTVIWNYEEYVTLYEQHLQAFATKDFSGLPPRPPDLDLNRRILNCLSSIRMYLDHVETYTKETYGHESANALNFLKRCSEAYDQSFAYRFLYALRNFAQHYGLPLSGINYRGRINYDDLSKPHRTLEVGIDRDKLLATKFKWKKLKEEITSQPPNILVNPLVAEMREQLQEIHIHFIADELNTVRPHAFRLRDFIRRVQRPFTDIFIYTHTIDDGEKVGFTITPVPMDMMEDVLEEKLR